MCGIYGIIGLKDERLLREMGKELAHRGPDDQQEYLDKDVGLGYRRLAIIDTKGSFQPLFNENKSLVLFFNGEIYNYKDLREKLSKHKFKTNGDGETIIHWYEDHGPEGFKDLNGIFSFSLFDKKKNKLYLVRDHFGIKPLYYWQTTDKLVFASEIKAILKVLGKQKSNEKILANYLLNRVHDNTEETFFEGIRRVPHASYLEWSMGTSQYRVRPYWRLQNNPNLIKETEQENIAEFKRLFLQAVDRQLMSEVPLGTALSGGLDSSAIVMAIKKPHQQSFSAIFPGEVNNEKVFIDEVVKASGVEKHSIEPARREMWQEIATMIKIQDEPQISSGPYAQLKVIQLASKNTMRVMLDGQGADELLAGYDPYFFVYFRELFHHKKLLTLIKEIILSFPILKKYLFAKKSFSTAGLFNLPEIPALPAIHDDLNERLNQDLLQNSLPALLRYEDHNSMSQSIEARVPFLDIDLVEFVVSLPSNYKIRNGWTKWIMRQALKDILPEKILKRKWKVGFTTPEISWMRKSKSEIEKIFTSPSFNSRPYFNPQEIRKRFEEFASGQNDESMVFWRIINVELWLRKYID